MEGKSETKRREKADKTVSLIQIVNKDSLCWGCRLNSVDSLWEDYGLVVFMKEFDGFW